MAVGPDLHTHPVRWPHTLRHPTEEARRDAHRQRGYAGDEEYLRSPLTQALKERVADAGADWDGSLPCEGGGVGDEVPVLPPVPKENPSPVALVQSTETSVPPPPHTRTRARRPRKPLQRPFSSRMMVQKNPVTSCLTSPLL